MDFYLAAAVGAAARACLGRAPALSMAVVLAGGASAMWLQSHAHIRGATLLMTIPVGIVIVDWLMARLRNQ